PSGSQLAWRASSRSLVVISRDGEKPLTRSSGEENGAGLSPDGRVVIFGSNREGRWGLYATAVDRAPNPTPALLQWLDDLPSRTLLTGWTNDGFTTRYTFDESNIWLLPMDSSTGRPAGVPERLTQD